MEQFIKDFADQFDDTDINEITPATEFRQLDEWSSLSALAVLNMIEKKYHKQISVADFKTIITVEELYKSIKE